MKKFKDVKPGDTLYCVEVSYVNAKFETITVIRNEYNYWLNEWEITYKDNRNKHHTPLYVNGDSASLYGMIFTEREEAVTTYRRQILRSLRYHHHMADTFAEKLEQDLF